MKQDIHPAVHPVVFVDTSCGAEFITTSTLTSDQTRDIDGVPHYVINIEISSASHPFFTGEERFVDTAGRVDKFKEKMTRVEEAAKQRKGKKAKRAAKKAKAGTDTKKKTAARATEADTTATENSTEK